MKLDGNNNKNKLYISIIVGLLFLFVVGISFAYFQTQYGNGGKVDLKAKTYSVDELSFNIGEDITLNPNQFNFAQGKGNLEGETNASAILKANNKTNLAKMNYYAYVVVTKNEFKYTTSDKKAELVLSVEGPDGVVTTLPDLGNAIDVTDNEGNTFKGFDITEFSGVITLADNKEIEVTSSDNGKKQEDWKIKVTFINLDADQSSNSDKNFNANMMIQKEEADLSYHNICSDNSISCHIAKLYTGTQGENNIYYHDASLTNGAGDNSYRYAGASDAVNNYVCFGSNVTPCPTDNLYRIIGVFGDKVKLIKSDYATTALLGADGDYSKMYTANGLDNSNYKGNNLANIAGYTWNYKNNTTINSGCGSNTWSTSLLNKTNLNKNFITNIGADWAAKIADTTWKVGGNTWANIGTQPAKTAYQNEIVSPVTTNSTDNAKEYNAKVGLMYVSDYMYAAPQDKWTLVGYNNDASKDYRAATSVNWMYMGLWEWTISRNAGSASRVFIVYDTGLVDFYDANGGLAVRPVFYLTSSVNYASGSGTATDPIVVT